MDNNTCINCSHSEVCKYRDELDRKIKELNVSNVLYDKGDPIFALELNCRFYKMKESPIEKVETVSFPVNKEELFKRIF